MLQGCHQVAKALNVPPTAVLGGYVVLCSYVLSPSIVTIPGTDWTEPVLIWLTVAMPTGSGKSTLFRHLYNLLSEVRREAGVAEDDPTWVLDDATFEKMGALMHENCSRILGFYDELSSFLTQVNLFRGRQLSDSHELVLAGTSWDVAHMTSWDVPGCMTCRTWDYTGWYPGMSLDVHMPTACHWFRAGMSPVEGLVHPGMYM